MIYAVRSLSTIPRPEFYLGVAWLVVLVAAIAFGPSRVPHVDFDAFYCAGHSLAHGMDPYRNLALNACERRIHSRGPAASGATVPAPLPPYALGPYALLSRLPAESAYLLFTCLSVSALFATLPLLTRLTGAGTLLAVAAVASASYDDVLKGQPVPFVVLAIVIAGWALRVNHTTLAAVAAAATMVEPHIGLPVCVTLFLWVPGSRRTLTGVAFVLGAVSFLTVPFHVVLAYFTTVLPMQAASEATWATQLSLTNALTVLGVPAKWALSIGFAQYGITSLIGIAVARIVATRSEAPEALAFLPPLFAVIGGTYVHNSLLLVAIPASFFVVQHKRSATTYAGLAAIAPYWIAMADPINLFLIVLLVYTTTYTWRRSVKVSLLCAATVAGVGVTYVRYQPVFKTPPTLTVTLEGYAEESWAQFVRAVTPDKSGQWLALLIKSPTWVGLLVISSMALSITSRRSSTPNHLCGSTLIGAPLRTGELLPNVTMNKPS